MYKIKTCLVLTTSTRYDMNNWEHLICRLDGSLVDHKWRRLSHVTCIGSYEAITQKRRLGIPFCGLGDTPRSYCYSGPSSFAALHLMETSRYHQMMGYFGASSSKVWRRHRAWYMWVSYTLCLNQKIVKPDLSSKAEWHDMTTPMTYSRAQH